MTVVKLKVKVETYVTCSLFITVNYYFKICMCDDSLQLSRVKRKKEKMRERA